MLSSDHEILFKDADNNKMKIVKWREEGRTGYLNAVSSHGKFPEIIFATLWFHCVTIF
jgi:hypothetical protein